ncbi:CehA/McbA family metallohydrolase [Streptomyces sp. NBC_00555]|uniref:CehA/McbA family metallohydrolase n=1 Tax=Streptomyces sp. NBC_00555 TaxID=2903662 RepID=UPI0022586FD1|nr:CehA/McbA family metallohydrolase [Streptomyces sp. NBC_00555]MCX5015288.1 CehA/McbA family metallohydrolase [Streptomyces sp. NBC_00555]
MPSEHLPNDAPDPGPGVERRSLLRLAALLAAGGAAALVPAPIVHAATRGQGSDAVTTTYRGHSPYGNDQWAYVAFDVPAGVQRISVSTSHDAAAGILDLGIFGPSGFRGWSGGERSGFTLSAADATPGYVPGPVEPGSWSVILGPMVGATGGMAWQVDVTLHLGDPLPRTPYDILPASVTGCGPGWYRGDLHLHSVHSDGKRTVDEIVAAARQEGLHFIATSDHNTSSTGVTWHGNIPTDLLVINAEEVTTRHGHWLAVGLPQGEWVDWRYGPADQGVFDGHARRVHSLGGLTIAAHPLTPAPGSFWEFGLDRVDALEVWNGPWTLDDAANIAAWHVMLSLGKRVAAVGNSDAHSPADAVGRPHNVVRASSLSTPAVLDALRLGRSYAVESAAVTVDFTARAGGAVAGPGEELPLSFFDAVDVTLDVTGAPDSIATLYTEWGIMAATCIDGSGRGQLRWRGWGKASMFARAEVRRPKPASTTLDQLVAITNPVWFYSAQLPPYDVERRALFHTERRPDGSWSSMRPLPGAAVAGSGSGSGSGSFAGVQSAAAGMADGSVVVLGIAPDNGMWLSAVRGSATLQPWQRVAGPDGSAGFTVREADIAAFPDGTCQIVVTAMDGTAFHQQRRADGALPGFRALPGFTAKSGWGATKVSITAMPDGSAQLLSYGTDGAMYHCVRGRSGTWTAWGRLAGYNGAPTFSGPALAITGMPDGSSQVLAIGLDGMVYHQQRRPDGSWTGFRPPRGVTTATMGASAIGITGTPDGSAQVVAVGLDGRIWHNVRNPDGSWTPFAHIPGPNGRDPFPAGQVRITALHDGTTHVTAISAG